MSKKRKKGRLRRLAALGILCCVVFGYTLTAGAAEGGPMSAGEHVTQENPTSAGEHMTQENSMSAGEHVTQENMSSEGEFTEDTWKTKVEIGEASVAGSSGMTAGMGEDSEIGDSDATAGIAVNSTVSGGDVGSFGEEKQDVAGSKLTGYEFLVGDVDGNGEINARDKRIIYNHIAGTSLLWQ